MCTVTALNGSPLYKDDPSREHVITYKKKALRIYKVDQKSNVKIWYKKGKK